MFPNFQVFKGLVNRLTGDFWLVLNFPASWLGHCKLWLHWWEHPRPLSYEQLIDWCVACKMEYTIRSDMQWIALQNVSLSWPSAFSNKVTVTQPFAWCNDTWQSEEFNSHETNDCPFLAELDFLLTYYTCSDGDTTSKELARVITFMDWTALPTHNSFCSSAYKFAFLKHLPVSSWCPNSVYIVLHESVMQHSDKSPIRTL